MTNKENTQKPQRMCIACRKRDEKRNLIRIVNQNGLAQIDFIQKSQCRGVYLCQNRACVQKAQKTKALSRSLQCAVDEGFWDEIIRSIKD